MERLNWHMADELAKHAELQVVGPTGAAKLTPPSVMLTEAPLKPPPQVTSSLATVSLTKQALITALKQ